MQEKAGEWWVGVGGTCVGVQGRQGCHTAAGEVGVCWIGGGMCWLLGERVDLAMTKILLCVHPHEESTHLQLPQGRKMALGKNTKMKQTNKKFKKPKLRRQNPLEILESCVVEAVNKIRDSPHQAKRELPVGTKFHNFSLVGSNWMLLSLPAKNNSWKKKWSCCCRKSQTFPSWAVWKNSCENTRFHCKGGISQRWGAANEACCRVHMELLVGTQYQPVGSISEEAFGKQQKSSSNDWLSVIHNAVKIASEHLLLPGHWYPDPAEWFLWHPFSLPWL